MLLVLVEMLLMVLLLPKEMLLIVRWRRRKGRSRRGHPTKCRSKGHGKMIVLRGRSKADVRLVR
jgi:hypothetical protein